MRVPRIWCEDNVPYTGYQHERAHRFFYGDEKSKICINGQVHMLQAEWWTTKPDGGDVDDGLWAHESRQHIEGFMRYNVWVGTCNLHLRKVDSGHWVHLVEKQKAMKCHLKFIDKLLPNPTERLSKFFHCLKRIFSSQFSPPLTWVSIASFPSCPLCNGSLS